MSQQSAEVMEEIDAKSSIALLKNLIKINSINPPGNELEVAKVIDSYARDAGLHTVIKPLTKNRSNIIVRLNGKDPSRAPLIFSGHLDTVPIGDNTWNADPFSGEIIDGKLYGRGTSDMKGGVAALIEAMKVLNSHSDKPDADIIFVGTAGEEVDCFGASEIIKDDTLKNAAAMIIAEPSNGKVFCAHKGALWLQITVYGKTAHGSMPEQGTNAIIHMHELLDKLRRYKFTYTQDHNLLGKPTLNIGTITGGIQTNVVPDRCTVTLDIRTIPETSHQDIINDIEGILAMMNDENQDFNAEIEVKNNLPALENVNNNEFVQLAMDVNYDLYGVKKEDIGANYYTDASIYSSALNIPIIIYGPGNEAVAHQPDEYIEIESFLNSISYYVELARRY